MKATTALRRYRRARRRVQLGLYACGAFPIAFAAMMMLWRILGLTLVEAALAALALLALQVVAVDWLRRAHRVTASSVARHLDHRYPTLEDSTGLIGDRSAAPLKRLQRARIGERLLALRAAGALSAAPRRAAQWRAVGLVCLGAAIGNVVWLAPALQWTSPAAPANRTATPALGAVSVAVQPPAYTGLAATASAGADVRAVEFSRLAWSVETTAAARRVEVVTDSGDVIPLRADDGLHWRSEPWLARATTYRIRLDGAPAAVGDEGIVHRVAIVRDAPPVLSIDQPARGAVAVNADVAAADDRSVAVRVSLSATDDYAVAGVTGRATLATGSGEQVKFRETPIALAAEAGDVGTRVDTEIDLAELGMTPGSELYLFFEARDNRPGQPNVTASSTYVFRWPAAEDAPALMAEGQAIDVPAEYFRSQRQIIIDTEALIEAAPALAEREFANRAQALAFDQKALRLRYGQFLGEEDESGIGPMPTGAGGEGIDEHADEDGHDDHDEDTSAAHDGAHFPGDGHDHGDDAPADGSRFGDAAAAIAPYAHFHDQEEQSTLFDPETMGLLRRALSAMWDSEGELRMRRPDDALPHQYRALELIKRVQQRSRIYVARVGFRPTPIDEGRRLSGELDGIATGPAPLAAADQREDATLEDAVRALAAGAAPPAADHAAALLDWLGRGADDARASRDVDREERLQRARQALLEWQSRTDCADCRGAVLDAVWRYWRNPIAIPARRRAITDPFAGSGQAVSAR